jgi:hypothetical protein
MKIKREDFLNDLHMVRAGLSTKELLEQSNCYAFKDGYVFTYNDEIACHKKTAMTLGGAVPAQKLLGALEKLKADDWLEVHHNADGQLEFRNLVMVERDAQKKLMLGSRNFSFTRDVEVLLPIEKITEEMPKMWAKLPENFSEVIDRVKDCVSTNEADNWSLTCVHFHPKWIEACNNLQLMRYHIQLGNPKPILIRGAAISNIIGLGMTHMAATPNWVHFKNGNGLVYSARKFVDQYPPGMDEVLQVKGKPIKLPPSLLQAGEIAALWGSDHIQGVETTIAFHLTPPKQGRKTGAIMIEGRGLSGDFYKETIPCSYSGPPLQFVLTPTLLKHIISNYRDAQITDRKLKATGGVPGKSGYWEYVSVLSRPRKHPVPVAEPAPLSEEETAERAVASQAADAAAAEDGLPF